MHKIKVKIFSSYIDFEQLWYILCIYLKTQGMFCYDCKNSTAEFILCEYIKALDISTRGFKFVETVPDDVLKEVTEKLYAIIEPYDN